MKSILVDAGPLIALFDKSDGNHDRAISFLRNFRGKLWTTWPVITETSHMLDFSVRTQLNFMIWIRKGGLHLIDIKDVHWHRIIELTEKYSDIPMDLADATLIVASEESGFGEIATIDSDFYVYRDIRNRYLKNIFL